MWVTPLTKEEILNYVSEEEILRRYGFYSNVLISSPFRKDENPSFKLFTNRGKIYFKDFTTNEAGDLFTFLQKLLSKNFKEVLKDITYKVLSNINLSRYSNYKNVNNTSEVIIHGYIKPYNTYELNYWNQYYIHESDLIKNNIYSLQSVDILTNNYKYSLVSSPDNPIFGYSFLDSDGTIKWKVYRPLEVKEEKWKNNIPKKAIFWFIVNDNPILIITKSIKDCLVLNNLGYNAVTGVSETIVFSKEFIDKCVEKTKVFLLYDYDLAGVSTANKIRKLNPKVQYFFTGTKYKNKDISDTICAIGYDSSKKYIDDKTNNFNKVPNPFSYQ